VRNICHILLALALTAGAHAEPAAAPAPQVILAPAALPLAQADPLAQQLFAASSSTGMMLVLVRNNETFIHGYGETAPASATAPDEKSLLRLCSLSKIFATDLLAKLVADHTVQLNNPLQLFAPPHAAVPTRLDVPITLESLATHTSGLPREVGNAPHGTPHFTFPGYVYRWRWLPAQHLKTTPGTAALYSNIGFDFLGDALARAAHMPYAELLATRTTTPLGMHETGFTPTAAQCARLLQGARDEGPCTDTQNSAASAGVYSTANDMAIFLRYLLDGQSPAAQAVYLDPASLTSVQGLDHAGTPSGIGLGWMHLLDDANPSAITEKTGGGAGFTTYVALNQHTHTALFVAFTEGTANNHVNVFKAANNLLLTIAGEPLLPIEALRPSAKRRPSQAARHSASTTLR
jgi:D-alanyl-D-alanine-carboxypeptidase/D-alanyl-D-alanine-endopeptidase